MNTAAQQIGYQQARGEVVNYVQRLIKRKGWLIEQQNQDPTGDRNKSLNSVETDIQTLLAYLMAVDAQAAQQQAQIDRLAAKVQTLDTLLTSVNETSQTNSELAGTLLRNHFRQRLPLLTKLNLPQ